MNEKWFERKGLYTQQDKMKMKALLLFLIIGLVAFAVIIIAGVTNASATTTTVTKQINITAVTIIPGNSSLETVMVEGVLYACSDGECVAYATFEFECPTCPDCPSINNTAVMENTTAGFEDLKLWFYDYTKVHNSSVLDDDDRVWLSSILGEEIIAGSATEIRGVLDETYIKKQEELNNLTNENTNLREEIGALKATIATQNTTISSLSKDIADYGEEEEESDTLITLFGGMVLVVVAAFVLYTFFDLGETVRTRAWVLKGREGWTSEEVKLKGMQEENARKAAKLAEKEEEEKGRKLDAELAQYGGDKESGKDRDGDSEEEGVKPEK